MAHGHSATLQPEKLNIGGVSARLGVPGLFVGVIALAVAVYLGFNDSKHPEAMLLHFYHAYLAAFVFFMAITLGSLAFVLIQHLARAGWSASVRRIAEGLSLNIFLLIIMIFGFFIPVHGETGAHRLLEHWLAFNPTGEHADPILKAKYAYLNPQFFAIRMGIYLVVWALIAWFFASQSAKQDRTGDPKISVRLEHWAKPAIVFFAFSLTSFIIDWVMSMNPHWFSTIFGVYYFAGCMLSAFSSIVLLTLALQKRGLIGKAVGHEHFHDLGKWMFAFTFFWGYIAFSQYMLIWYANLPEETQFYIPRTMEKWLVVSVILLIVHLLIPFPGLLSRHVKRSNRVIAFWAVWSLCACALDIFWLIIPNQWIGKLPAKAAEMTHGNPHMYLTNALTIVSDRFDPYHLNTTELKELANYPLTAGPMTVTILCFVGFAGLYLFSTMLALRGKSLVATRDPRLNEALAFENI